MAVDTAAAGATRGAVSPPRTALAMASWFAAVSLLWVGAVAVCPRGDCGVPAIDRTVLDVLDVLRTPALDAFFAGVTWFGSMFLLLPGASIVVAWLWRHGRRRAAGMIALSLGGAWLLAHAAKAVVARPRPELHEALIAMPADLSFPSAHTLQATALALAVALVVRQRWLWLAMAVLVGLVALSRLWLQVHFPSDVMFGFAAAACWTLGAHLLLEAKQ